MSTLGDVAEKVRSKNAGPFWLTIDVFCGSSEAVQRVRDGRDSAQVARMLDTPLQTLKRFDIADLNVIKISIPRPQVQGTKEDRDMHGAAAAAMLAEVDIP